MTLPTLSKTSKQKTKGQSENIRHPAAAAAERINLQYIPSFLVFAAGVFAAGIFAAGVAMPASSRLASSHLHVLGQHLWTASPRPASPRSAPLDSVSTDRVSAANVSAASVSTSWASVLDQRLRTASPRPASSRPAPLCLGPASSDSVFTPSFHVFTSWSGIFAVIAFASTAFMASVSESQYTKKKFLKHLTQ